jgi:DNA-binding transcriptional LysR family regulator
MKKGFTIDRDQLRGVLALLCVAEHRSFRAAAAELGISPSAVSQIVRRMEAHVGFALLTRTTRKVGLTEAGQHFMERARPAIDELIAAFETARYFGQRVAGLLRLNVPRAVSPYLADLVLDDFCAKYPDVQVEIFAEDRLVNIVEEGFDAGVRMGAQVERDMIAVRLTAPFKFIVVGTPDYFDRHGRPIRPEDLLEHRCIGFRATATDALYRWEFKDNNREFDIAVSGPIIVNDWALNITMAAKGSGLAYTPEPLAQSRIARGELEGVLDAFCLEKAGLFLYYPSRAQALPKLRAFVEFARTRMLSEFAGGS